MAHVLIKRIRISLLECSNATSEYLLLTLTCVHKRHTGSVANLEEAGKIAASAKAAGGKSPAVMAVSGVRVTV